MRNILGSILGFALASSAVGCIYRLGYVRGENAAMEGTPLRGCISAKCTPCAVHGTAPTGDEAPTGEEVAR